MTSDTEKTELVMLYDGKCNVCNAAVNFTINRVGNKSVFKYASLQSNFAKEKLKELKTDCFENKEQPDIPSTSAVIVDGKIYTHFDASVVSLKLLMFPYDILGNILSVVPSSIGNFFYRKFAANRFLLFGGTDEVQAFPPEKDFLFLDRDEGIHSCPLPKKKK